MLRVIIQPDLKQLKNVRASTVPFMCYNLMKNEQQLITIFGEPITLCYYPLLCPHYESLLLRLVDLTYFR